MLSHSKSNNDGGYGDTEPTSNLWVGNLAMDVTESDLTILFERHGAVDSVTLYSSRSYAFVCYKQIKDAKSAKDALQGTVLRGHAIKIDFAKPVRSNSLGFGGFLFFYCYWIWIYYNAIDDLCNMLWYEFQTDKILPLF